MSSSHFTEEEEDELLVAYKFVKNVQELLYDKTYSYNSPDLPKEALADAWLRLWRMWKCLQVADATAHKSFVVEGLEADPPTLSGNIKDPGVPTLKDYHSVLRLLEEDLAFPNSLKQPLPDEPIAQLESDVEFIQAYHEVLRGWADTQTRKRWLEDMRHHRKSRCVWDKVGEDIHCIIVICMLGARAESASKKGGPTQHRRTTEERTSQGPSTVQPSNQMGAWHLRAVLHRDRTGESNNRAGGAPLSSEARKWFQRNAAHRRKRQESA